MYNRRRPPALCTEHSGPVITSDRARDERFGAKLGSAGVTYAWLIVCRRPEQVKRTAFSIQVDRNISVPAAPCSIMLPSLGREARNFVGMRHIRCLMTNNQP